MQTRSKLGISKPKVPYIGITLADSAPTPTTTKEALLSPPWKQVVIEEFTALQRNKTWTLVPRPRTQTIVDNKWIFKSKFHSNGTLAKRKVRLVAKGFQQTHGIDFFETFSPVIKASTICIILTIVVALGWEIRQLDINNAFLNGYLTKPVLMEQL